MRLRRRIRSTPYAFASHIANAIHAPYRLGGPMLVTLAFMSYEIQKHILRDAEQHAGLHGRGFKPWHVSADNRQEP
jgi:hypothetical protein